MLRIRIGENWKQNPRYVEALRALAEGRSKGFSPRDIVDALGIELDGVDVAEGLGEAGLVDALGALVRAARALATGSGTERVSFTGGRLTLALIREGEDVRLKLEKPLANGVVFSHDCTLAPKVLLTAVNAAVRAFLDDLERIHPALPGLRTLRALRAETMRPTARRPGPRSLAPEFAAQVAVGDGQLSVRADRSALTFLAADGRVAWACPDAPRALRELLRALDGAGPLPGAVERDEALASLRFGRSGPVSVARVREALGLLCGQLGLETESVDDAPEPMGALARTEAERPPRPRRPEHPTSGLRRLMLRAAWRADAAHPRPRLQACGAGLIVRGANHTELRRADGSLGWRAGAGDASVVRNGRRELVLARDSHGALILIDAASGARLVRIPAVVHGRVRSAHVIAGGRVVACDGARLVAVPVDGGRPWTFEPARDRGLAMAAAGGVVVAGSDAGQVFGLDADGKLAWQGPSGLALVDALRLDLARGLVLVTGLDASGRAAAAALRVTDGEAVWTVSMAGVRPGPPVLLRGRICLPHEATSATEVVALDAGTGRALWRLSPPGEGSATLVPSGGRIYVARTGGGLAALTPAGKVAFLADARDPDPSLSPVRPRPAVVEAGLAVVLAALAHVYDAATGRHLATLEPAELAPESVAILPGPTLVIATREGLLEAWRATGHLRVI